MQPQNQISVLIAEDDFIVSEAIQKGLEELGYTVAGKAPDGRQAVEMTQALQPDVVLMDIKMPDMHGLEATRNICLTCPTPVVILTANDTPDMVKQAGEAGAGAYLVKIPKAREIERAIEIATARFDDMMELRRLNIELQSHNEALRKERDFAESLVNTAQAIILVLDAAGRIVRFNPYMEELSGYASAEVKGKDWFSTFLAAQDHSRIRALFQKAVGDIRTKGNVNSIVIKNGSERKIEWYDKTLKDADGNVVGILAVGQDITERMRTDKSLRESEGKLNAMLRSIGDHISMMDKDLNILWANDVASEVFGREIIGQKCYEIYHGRDSPCEPFPCLTLKAFEDGLIHKHETRVQNPDGKTTYFACTASVALRDKAGNPAAVIEIFHDITERKTMEKERHLLEQRRHRVEKAESLSRMAGAVAHHFNNMLYAVTGNLEMALEDLASEGLASDNLAPNADIIEKIAEARKAALRAAEMSGLMLTYLGQSLGKPEPLDLSQICRQHLAQWSTGMPPDIHLDTDFPSPGPVVEADSSQIRQILTALVTNAAEAMDGFTGTVQISVSAVKAVETMEGHRVPVEWTPSAEVFACLSITDTGRGMDAETIGRIFDPFYTDKFTGRGLGLAVTLGIVKSRGGCVTLTSEPKQGSVFRVFLPLSPRSFTPRPEDSTGTPAFESGGVVLVADDQNAVRDVAKAMLTMIGFEVVTAKDGVEAVEIFRERQADIRLVLTDLSMPQMNGWETLAALRRIRPNIPVILSSGYDEARAMDGNYGEQPQAFLPKPYQIKTLKDALAKALA